MMTWPKPVQKPHPPVIVGGAYPYGARRAIAYGDGWVPHARRPAYGEVLGLLPEFQKMAAEAGRDPATRADHGLRRGRGRRPDQALSRCRRGPHHLQPASGQGRRGAAGPRPLRRADALGTADDAEDRARVGTLGPAHAAAARSRALAPGTGRLPVTAGTRRRCDPRSVVVELPTGPRSCRSRCRRTAAAPADATDAEADAARRRLGDERRIVDVEGRDRPCRQP